MILIGSFTMSFLHRTFDWKTLMGSGLNVKLNDWTLTVMSQNLHSLVMMDGSRHLSKYRCHARRSATCLKAGLLFMKSRDYTTINCFQSSRQRFGRQPQKHFIYLHLKSTGNHLLTFHLNIFTRKCTILTHISRNMITLEPKPKNLDVHLKRLSLQSCSGQTQLNWRHLAQHPFGQYIYILVINQNMYTLNQCLSLLIISHTFPR